jgi:dTMP kinase
MTGAGAKFITLEGVDGAGKSTHIEFIADALRAGGRHVIVTREPGGTEVSEAVRAIVLRHPMLPLAETLLLVAARAEHVARVIRPTLEAGTTVVCDRFADATVAYQGAGKGVPLDLLRTLAHAVHPRLAPDLTLVFDCSYEVASARMKAAGRALDRFEREDRAFFERVRESYLEAAKGEPGRVRVIDASQDVAAIRGLITQNLRDL